MSALTDLIYAGANTAIERASKTVDGAIAARGAECPVGFGDTASFFPAIYAATGMPVSALGDLPACVDAARALATGGTKLEDALKAGLAAVLGAEIAEGVRALEAAETGAATGFVGDPAIRSLGVPLVTGDIPGVAVVLGAAQDASTLAGVVRDYQAKGLLTFLAGGAAEQAAAAGVKLGLEFRVVPLGSDVTRVIHAVTVAVRVALIFGKQEPGDLDALLAYTRARVPAFVNAFGPLDAETVALGAGAIAMGFPVVTDQELGELAVPGALESANDPAEMVKKSLELRGIRIRVKQLPIPVAFASAFEGEIIRRKDMRVEFYSGKNVTCELVKMRAMEEVEDHRLVINGPDLDGGADEYPLAVLVEVAGAKIQSDFESVIERKIHAWFNYMEGVMHTGQRNLFRVRVSREAFDKGLRLRHFGEVIYHMVMDEFEAVVDRCQVTLVTDPDAAARVLNELALPAYARRDDRLASMTDESVDTFYTCTLCQSFAPAHCCVITPERLGLCGAVSWLDAKATYQLNPIGPSRPIAKEECADARTGRFETVNRAVTEATQGAVESVCLYSLLEDPMTSCGCFECICGVLPECNGVVVVNREYGGMTPTGMTFGELASMTGGGVQTPGFMGLGRHFIASRKFVSAEGGPLRIVWMPKALKDEVAPRLNRTVKELYGIDDFTDRIGDETVTCDSMELIEWLTEKDHPALGMDAIL